MYVSRGVWVDQQQAIVGVWKRAVCRKPHGSASSDDNVEPRVFTSGKATPQHLRRKPVRRPWDQIVTRQLQDRHGVTWNGASDRVEQPSKPVLRGEGRCQVDGDREQCIQGVHCYVKHNIVMLG